MTKIAVNTMKSVALHNLGCKVNAYELEAIGQKLQEKGTFSDSLRYYYMSSSVVVK